MSRKPRLTAAEKEARKHERKAAAMTAAEAKAYGPLFAHLAPVHTRGEAYWNWRRTKAYAGEETFHGVCIHEFRRFTLTCVRAEAARRIGLETADKLAACFEKYPLSYRRRHWRDALAGVGTFALRLALEFSPDRVNQWNHDGRKVVTAEAWPPAGYKPIMTADEFDERFPDLQPDPELPEPDDGGLFDRVMNAIGGKS